MSPAPLSPFMRDMRDKLDALWAVADDMDVLLERGEISKPEAEHAVIASMAEFWGLLCELGAPLQVRIGPETSRPEVRATGDIRAWWTGTFGELEPDRW